MLKGQRCYCNRLYPGSRCAYHRLADELAELQPSVGDELKEGVRAVAETGKTAAAKPASLWGRLTTYGKFLLGR